MKKLLFVTGLAAALAAILAGQTAGPRVPTGVIVGNAIGRGLISIDGTMETIGYFSSVDGLGSRIFDGSPSERTARLTFRSTRMRLLSTPNGGIFQFRLEPVGEEFTLYRVYYDSSPDQDFGRPDTFSDGRLVATYRIRTGNLTAIPPVYTSYTATLEFVDSEPFTIEGVRVDAKQIARALTVTFHGPGLSLGDLPQLASIPFSGALLAAE